jgi:hypothetical protein
MTGYLIAAAVGAIVKTLVPVPKFDDPVRAAYRWVKNKIIAWANGNDNGVQ